MNDVNKLGAIISSLEDQARKVSEFSGLLSAVNDARKEIEMSKKFLEAGSTTSRLFLQDSVGHFDRLSRQLIALEKHLEQIQNAQHRASDQLMSLDILTPAVFAEASKASEILILDSFNKIEGKLNSIQIAHAKHYKNIKLFLLAATIVVLVAFAVLR